MAQINLDGKGLIGIGIILETPDGKVLFQLRDNKKGIHYPGCWSIFTGGLEESDWDGELPSSLKKGILREISEELSVIDESGKYPFVLDGDQINLFDERIYRDEKNDYCNYQYVFHAVIDVPLENLKLNEGQKLGVFGKEDIYELNFAPSYEDIIKKFFLAKEEKRISRLKCQIEQSQI